MKAITTRYIGATERKPARILASDLDHNRITLPADGDFPYTDRHRAAAVALCAKMGWPGAETLIGGTMTHGMVWVFPDPEPTAIGTDQPVCQHPEYYTIHAAHGQHRCLGCGYQFTASRAPRPWLPAVR